MNFIVVKQAEERAMLLQKKADTIHLIMVKPVPGKERLYTILGEDGIYNEKKLAEFQQKHSVVTTIILNIPRLPEALEWKLQYIRAFNQMENFIREKSTQMWIETRKAGKLTRKAETDTIQKLVEYAKGQGSSHAEMLYMTYSRLANKMAGINKRDEATVMQLNNLSLMENIILHEVDLGIMRGKHYQEIYRDCKKRLEAVKDLAYLEAV